MFSVQNVAKLQKKVKLKVLVLVAIKLGNMYSVML